MQKEEHPLPEQDQLKGFDFSIDREQVCPTIEEYGQYKQVLHYSKYRIGNSTRTVLVLVPYKVRVYEYAVRVHTESTSTESEVDCSPEKTKHFIRSFTASTRISFLFYEYSHCTVLVRRTVRVYTVLVLSTVYMYGVVYWAVD